MLFLTTLIFIVSFKSISCLHFPITYQYFPLISSSTFITFPSHFPQILIFLLIPLPHKHFLLPFYPTIIVLASLRTRVATFQLLSCPSFTSTTIVFSIPSFYSVPYCLLFPMSSFPAPLPPRSSLPTTTTTTNTPPSLIHETPGEGGRGEGRNIYMPYTFFLFSMTFDFLTQI